MKQRISTYLFILGLMSTTHASTNNNSTATPTNTRNSLVIKGNANAGFTFSNTVQQQTYLDNYPNDYGNGPLSSADFSSTLMLYDSANSVSILDVRNSYYDKIKTDTAGVGIVYRYKPKKGTLVGINAAYDYTDYDGMYFSQIAVGAETNYQDFDAIFNFYIPKGGSSTYEDWTSGSTLRGLYGADLTLSKKYNNLQTSIMGSYHYHDEVKDNISAVTISSDYNTASMFGIGASCQYRRGLDSSDTGYKVYTKVPLFRTTHRNTHNDDMYAPAKRQLGPIIQYVKDDACEDNGFETFAAYGINHCGGLNPFDSAYLKSGSTLRDGAHLGDGLIDMSSRDFVAKTNRIYHITSPTQFKSITVEPGSMVIMGPNVQLFTTGTFTSGSETGSTKPALILSEAALRRYALNTKASGLSSMAKKFSDYTNSYTNLGSAIIVTSTAGSLNAATASTDTTRTQQNIQTADFYANYFYELTHTDSPQGSQTTTISPRSDATNPLIKKMTQIGSGSNAVDNTIINSVQNTLIDGPTLVTMGANNWIKDSVIKANKQLAIYGGITSLEANIIKSPPLANSTIEMAFGAQVVAYANTMVSNDVYKDHVTLKLPTSHHQNSKAEITALNITDAVAQDYRWANQQLLSNFNVYYATNGVRNSIINLMDQHGVGLGYEISSVNDKVILGSYAKNSSDTINWTFGGMDLSDLSDTGYRATASEHSDHNIQNMSIFIDGFTDNIASATNLSTQTNRNQADRLLLIGKASGIGRAVLPIALQMQTQGISTNLAYLSSNSVTSSHNLAFGTSDSKHADKASVTGEQYSAILGLGITAENSSPKTQASVFVGKGTGVYSITSYTAVSIKNTTAKGSFIDNVDSNSTTLTNIAVNNLLGSDGETSFVNSETALYGLEQKIKIAKLSANIEEYDNTAARIFSDLSIPFSNSIEDGYSTTATSSPTYRVIGGNGVVAAGLAASTSTSNIFPFDITNNGLFYYANAKLYTDADISNYFAATYGNGIKSDYIEALTSGQTVQ